LGLGGERERERGRKERAFLREKTIKEKNVK
jgi:hypothetical protein